ncbi:hypothetical protein EW145_g2156 [Phellinidium pouzarii]|uniref:AAA-ATPase-like domain-containing protein n=1 Tax=Phellinidium pouzarii TaxID=167371 RepID=A0A4V6S196_9AGAM|nr:hypothetical protein EW145_g2156 [Phellinidium pouzarii]
MCCPPVCLRPSSFSQLLALLSESMAKTRQTRRKETTPEQPQETATNCLVSVKDDLTTSVSDFVERMGYFDYVDKTPVILAFLKVSYPIHLVLRPRRCGKTTLLTMFRAFFEMGSQEDVEKRRKLFFAMPSLISMSPMFETYFAQHPVIYIDMSVS